MGGGPYRPGSGVLPPRILREVKAGYTEEARRANVEGEVVLEIVVRRDGSVSDVKLLNGLPQRAERARDCGRAPMAIRAGDTTGSGGRRHRRGRRRIQAEVTPWIRYFSSSRSSPPRRRSSQSHPHGASGVTIASGRTLASRRWRAPQKRTAHATAAGPPSRENGNGTPSPSTRRGDSGFGVSANSSQTPVSSTQICARARSSVPFSVRRRQAAGCRCSPRLR